MKAQKSVIKPINSRDIVVLKRIVKENEEDSPEDSEDGDALPSVFEYDEDFEDGKREHME